MYMNVVILAHQNAEDNSENLDYSFPLTLIKLLQLWLRTETNDIMVNTTTVLDRKTNPTEMLIWTTRFWAFLDQLI